MRVEFRGLVWRFQKEVTLTAEDILEVDNALIDSL